jgi:serpin B
MRPYRLGPLAGLLVVPLLVATACGSPAPPAPPPAPTPVALDVPADAAARVAADDRFGLDLLAAAPGDGNLAVSPASVALALQMVATGARGRTATQLAAVLHLPSAQAAATSARALLTGLAAAEGDRTTSLHVADTVWAQQGMRLAPAFGTALRTSFDAAPRTTDFAHHPDRSRQRINSTVATQTGGLIPSLFPPGSLDDGTLLVLTNAVYLAASWARAFPAEDTAPGPFTLAGGSAVRVPMMHSGTDATYGYAAGPGYQVVTLPYTGGTLAFTVLLPTGNSLTGLLDVVRDKGLPSVLDAVRPAALGLVLPKFDIATDLDLSGTLARLGMPDAFTAAADFSGITTDEPLRIQTVRHDAVVKVDEHGTTAAAATGVGMQATAIARPRTVTVDHPFLFVVTDTSTGAPLFLGRVTDPR